MSSRRVTVGNKDLPEYNLVLLGELGVGKSALAVKFITKRFIMEYDPKLEGTYTKTDTIENQDVVLKIMDTCDQEGSNPERYLHWAHGFLVTYSITRRSSFDTARAYLETVNQYLRITGRDKPTALIGNKMDLERYRTVSKAEGEKLASEFECQFKETSAADDLQSVEQIFRQVAREVMQNSDLPGLQPLFITEDRSSSLFHATSGVRRSKSAGKTLDVNMNKDRTGTLSKRQAGGGTTFRLFNKSFKIFN